MIRFGVVLGAVLFLINCSSDNGLLDSKVENVLATNVTSSSITVKWNSVAGAKDYSIIILDSINHVVTDYRKIDTFIVKDSLIPGVKYGFSVIANPDNGPSSQTSETLWQRTLP